MFRCDYTDVIYIVMSRANWAVACNYIVTGNIDHGTAIPFWDGYPQINFMHFVNFPVLRIAENRLSCQHQVHICQGMLGTFSPPPRVSDLGMHHVTCVTHVPWSLTGGFPWSLWRVKHSRHSRCMHNPQFTYLVKGSSPQLSVSGCDAW